jgi:hypothetical protein
VPLLKFRQFGELSAREKTVQQALKTAGFFKAKHRWIPASPFVQTLAASGFLKSVNRLAAVISSLL